MKKNNLRYCLKFIVFFLLAVAVSNNTASAQVNIPASYALIKRIIPQRASAFVVEQLPVTDKDVFEIESHNGKIILRGTNGVSVASALYDYLTNYAHCQLTWNGVNLKLPVKLPVIKTRVHKNTPY